MQSNNGCLPADDFRSKPDESSVALRDPCVDATLRVNVVGSSAGSAQATTGPPEEELLPACRPPEVDESVGVATPVTKARAVVAPSAADAQEVEGASTGAGAAAGLGPGGGPGAHPTDGTEQND